jgi:hypothetical protein
MTAPFPPRLPEPHEYTAVYSFFNRQHRIWNKQRRVLFGAGLLRNSVAQVVSHFISMAVHDIRLHRTGSRHREHRSEGIKQPSVIDAVAEATGIGVVTAS